jgi:tetraacyldisaccharide 4'-kinase
VSPLSRRDPLSSALSRLYGRLARARRSAFETTPDKRRRLTRPVISVGNLVVGGSGKTPVVARVAALLAEAGERPAILSRGYGRRVQEPGVVVVSDGQRLLADLDRAGDEPLMLARLLDGVGVFVSASRAEAGVVAEEQYGATVHLLDDGFQHLPLARDVDLVVVSPHDLEGEQLLPAGRLREPVETVRRADALLVTGATLVEARALAARWDVPKAFTLARRAAVPRTVEPYGAAPRVPRDAPVLAVAGIARPERFFDDLTADGWRVVDRLAFRDHHRFTRADVAEIAARVKQSGAALALTTEKDVMRLLPWRPLPMPVAWVPLTVSIEPDEDFRLWLLWRLAEARAAGDARDAGDAGDAARGGR